MRILVRVDPDRHRPTHRLASLLEQRTRPARTGLCRAKDAGFYQVTRPADEAVAGRQVQEKARASFSEGHSATASTLQRRPEQPTPRSYTAWSGSPPRARRSPVGHLMFVTFEGLDGSGRRRRPSAWPVARRGGPRGRRGARAGRDAARGGIRRLVLQGEEMSAWAEAALFAAARAELVDRGDRSRARGRQGRLLRSLRRLLGRLPGHRARPRRRPGPRAEPPRVRGPLPDRTSCSRSTPEFADRAAPSPTASSGEGSDFQRRVAEAYE